MTKSKTKEKIDPSNLVVHKIRLHPNNKQKTFFNRCCGAKRFAYNWALSRWELERNLQQEYGGKSPNASDIDKAFNRAKKEKFPWIYDVPSCVPQQAIKSDLKNAYNNFFRRHKQGAKDLGYPSYKKRNDGDSFELTSNTIKNTSINGNIMTLPKKAGNLRMGESIRFSGRIICTTIRRSGEKWYASFLIKTETRIPYVKADAGKAIGIDVGVAKYVALSNGQSYDSVSGRINQLRIKLVRAQKKLSRMQGPDKRIKQKASKGWIDQLKKVRSIHSKMADFRDNYSDQISAELTKEYGIICMEDLKLKNLTASARGNAEKHGKNVKAKAGLNRSMLDGGFYNFRRKIEYKSKRHEGIAVFVNPAYTSQRCNKCSHTSPHNRKSQSKFKCVECGYTENADINAAKNIKNDGIISLSAETLKAGPG